MRSGSPATGPRCWGEAAWVGNHEPHRATCFNPTKTGAPSMRLGSPATGPRRWGEAAWVGNHEPHRVTCFNPTKVGAPSMRLGSPATGPRRWGEAAWVGKHEPSPRHLLQSHKNGCPRSGFSDPGKHEPQLTGLLARAPPTLARVILSERGPGAVTRPQMSFTPSTGPRRWSDCCLLFLIVHRIPGAAKTPSP